MKPIPECEHGFMLSPGTIPFCPICLRARLAQAERERDAARAELAALKAPKPRTSLSCKRRMS